MPPTVPEWSFGSKEPHYLPSVGTRVPPSVSSLGASPLVRFRQTKYEVDIHLPHIFVSTRHSKVLQSCRNASLSHSRFRENVEGKPHYHHDQNISKVFHKYPILQIVVVIYYQRMLIFVIVFSGSAAEKKITF